MTKVEEVARAIAKADRFTGGIGWWMYMEHAHAAIEAMRYRDGTDEDDAIRISAAHAGLDAVCAIEVLNGWVDAALNTQEKSDG